MLTSLGFISRLATGLRSTEDASEIPALNRGARDNRSRERSFPLTLSETRPYDFPSVFYHGYLISRRHCSRSAIALVLQVTAIFGRLVNLIWFLLTWCLLVGVVGAVLAGLYLYHRADENLRAHIQQRLQSHYRALAVTIQSARLIERRGFEINGLSIAEPGAATPLQQVAVVERIFVRCKPRLEDLLHGEVALTEVVFQNPQLRASRKPDGSWSIQSLAKLPQLSRQDPPRLRIENGVIELVDTTTQPSRLLILRNLNATFVPQPGSQPGSCPAVEFVASFTGDHAHQVSFTGNIEPCDGRWQLSGETRGLTLSPSLYQSLPTELAGLFAPVTGLQTQMHLQFSASHDRTRDVPTEFLVQGNATRGRIDDPLLPAPITDLSARLVWNHAGIRVEQVEGRLGRAPLEFDYVVQDGHESVAGSVRGLHVDQNTANGFPPHLKKVWQSFQPQGSLSAAFTFSRRAPQRRMSFSADTTSATAGPWTASLRVDCHQMDFLWERVPYPLRAQTGTLTYSTNRLTWDLKSNDVSRPIQIQGDVVHPGKHWTGRIVANVPSPLKIDDDLIRASTEDVQRVLDQFHLRGEIQGALRVERHRSDAAPHTTMSLQLTNSEVQHDSFPYPIRQIAGRIERQGEHWQFLDLVGRNDDGLITCHGELKPFETSRRLGLKFVGTSIPLENELYEALPANTRRLWDQLQPRGVLDHVSTSYVWDAKTRKTDLDITVQNRAHASRSQGLPLSIHARSFPYTIDDLVGTIRYRNGEIRMDRLRGRNGELTISASGRARLVDDRWEIDFEQLSADRVYPRSELLAALPSGIRTFVQRSEFSGPVAVEGHLTLSGQLEPDSYPRATWDLELDVADSSMTLAWPLTQIAGHIRLRGSSSRTTVQCAGELNCDSAMWQGVHLTNVRGPLWLDGTRVLLGQWAKPPGSTASPSSFVGEAFNGSFECDAQLLLDRFDLQTRVSNIDLGEVVRDVARRGYNIRGLASGGLALSGAPEGTHTLQGNGGFTIQDTDLYELPFVLSLLNTLRTGSTDRTAFTSSDLEFQIRGDRVYFDRLDLKGPALTLKGVGDAGFDRDLNLDFYTLVGREESYIPAVRSILGLASRRFMRVNVTGTLDDPQMTREMLPDINQTLQRLFPEATEPAERVSQK